MTKLTNSQIEDFFREHLPYRVQVLVAHYWMTREPWTGDVGQLRACFEASLATGRLILNVLGVARKRENLGLPSCHSGDVTAESLGGTMIEIDQLPTSDYKLFHGFLLMVDKNVHFTAPGDKEYEWQRTHEAIERICHYLDLHIYQATGRTLELPLPGHA